MKKKLFVLIAATMMVGGIAGFALSQGMTLFGKVIAVHGDTVTIELEAGKGSSVAVGSSVEMEVKGGKAGGAGMDLLMGC
jgi:hypothetical protein